MSISSEMENQEMMMMMVYEPLIPGLPDEISEHCLLHLPYPYQTLARSVSSSWNRTISNPSFNLARKTLSLSLPYIFVLAHHQKSSSTDVIQWQAFDPRSSRWFVLPPMPCPNQASSPTAFACSSLPQQGVLYVLGGMRKNTESSLQSLITYRTETNQWSESSPMLTPRSFFAARNVDGKIYAAGGYGERLNHTVSTMDCYDPEKDTWKQVANMRSGFASYDAAVMGKMLYVREGSTKQPINSSFRFPPRGGIYDPDTDTWKVMSVEMREGWTGTSVVLYERLFVMSEQDEDCRMKVYDCEGNTWQDVGGGEFPCEAVQRPFAVSGVEGRIYVVGLGLVVAIGSLCEEGVGRWRVEWEVVEMGPEEGFQDFSPCSSQVVYG